MPFFQLVGISFDENIHAQVFDRDRRTHRYLRDIGVTDVSAVDEHNRAAADGFEVVGLRNYNTGIFSESDAYAGGVAGNGLREAVEPASFIEVRVNDDIFYKGEPCGNLYLTLEVGQVTFALVDHGVAHGHGAGAGAGYHQSVAMVAALQDVEKFRSAEDGGKPELVATAEHDSAGVLHSLNPLRVAGVITVSDIEYPDIFVADFAKGLQVIFCNFGRDTARRSDDFDAAISTHFLVYSFENTEFEEMKIGMFPVMSFTFGAFVFGATYGD